MQRYDSAEGLYQMSFPRHWDFEIHEGIPAFFDPLLPNPGVLQIFAADLSKVDMQSEAYRSSPFLDGDTLREKMLLFLGSQISYNDEDVMQEAIVNGASFIAHEYYSEGRFFLAAMQQRNNSFVLALYNREGVPEREEIAELSATLKSLQITP